jgi:PadR family transcriptional regulator PadR
MTTQFKKGIVELCVLKLISDQPMSGLQVIELMSQTLDVSENTIYPILRRLTAQQLFKTSTVPSTVGAPKKVYEITSIGEKQLKTSLTEWKDFLSDVSIILGGTYEQKHILK